MTEPNWRHVAVDLARDLLQLADDAGMPDSFKDTDSRVQRARRVIADDAADHEARMDFLLGSV